jgi:hypothetical protein
MGCRPRTPERASSVAEPTSSAADRDVAVAATLSAFDIAYRGLSMDNGRIESTRDIGPNEA